MRYRVSRNRANPISHIHFLCKKDTVPRSLNFLRKVMVGAAPVRRVNKSMIGKNILLGRKSVALKSSCVWMKHFSTREWREKNLLLGRKTCSEE